MTKHGEGLEARIRRYFNENPDEELTFEDICIKFGCPRRRAWNAVSRIKCEGHLDVVHVVRAVKGAK